MRVIKYHEQPGETVSEKNADNGSTHSSWVLRTNLPFTNRSLPQVGKNHHFVCVCLTPRSLRYLNITPSLGVPSLSGLRFHTSLTCTTLTLLTPPRSSQKPCPLASSPKAQGWPAPAKAACLQPTSGARCNGISISASAEGGMLWEVTPLGRVLEVLSISLLSELVWGGGLLT